MARAARRRGAWSGEPGSRRPPSGELHRLARRDERACPRSCPEGSATDAHASPRSRAPPPRCCRRSRRGTLARSRNDPGRRPSRGQRVSAYWSQPQLSRLRIGRHGVWRSRRTWKTIRWKLPRPRDRPPSPRRRPGGDHAADDDPTPAPKGRPSATSPNRAPTSTPTPGFLLVRGRQTVEPRRVRRAGWANSESMSHRRRRRHRGS